MKHFSGIYKMFLLTFLAMSLGLGHSYAQSVKFKHAEILEHRFDFKGAADLYKKILAKNNADIDAKIKLAHCYRLMNNSEQAEIWYGQVADLSSVDPIIKWYYAQALRNNGKYEMAQPYYAEYSRLVPDDPRGANIASGIDNIESYLEPDPKYNVVFVEDINTSYSDFGPMFYDKGLIFASNRSSRGVQDLWTQRTFLQLHYAEEYEEGRFSQPEKLRNPNGRYHEGPATFSPSEDTMVLTRSNYVKGRPDRSQDDIVKLKLFQMVFNPASGKWEDIEDAVSFNSDEYSVAHAALSTDGNIMFFSSDMEGGYGGSDLYMVKKMASGWSKPINLGPHVNTAGDEMFPFFSAQNVLYFSSNSLMGVGGLDIYMAEMDEEEEFEQVSNMGVPINSQRDDFAFIINENNTKGFFTSNRQGKFDDDDIYMFTRKPVQLIGEVCDCATKRPIEGAKAQVKQANNLINLERSDEQGIFHSFVDNNKKYEVVVSKKGYESTTEMVKVKDEETVTFKTCLRRKGGIQLHLTVVDCANGTPLSNADVGLLNLLTSAQTPNITDANGTAVFDLQNDMEYSLSASKRLSDDVRFPKNSKQLSTTNLRGNIIYDTLCLDVFEIGRRVVLENIYYDLDEHYIRPDAARELDKLAKLLKDNPRMEIELSSHTDCRESYRYNLELSARRAKAALDYLASYGIDTRRIIAVGYGELRLDNNCECEYGFTIPCTEDQHQANRRTEFKILRF